MINCHTQYPMNAVITAFDAKKRRLN